MRRMDQILECSGVRKTQEKLRGKTQDGKTQKTQDQKTQDSHFFAKENSGRKTQDSHFLAESAQSLVHQRQHPLNFSGCRVDGALR